MKTVQTAGAAVTPRPSGARGVPANRWWRTCNNAAVMAARGSSALILPVVSAVALFLLACQRQTLDNSRPASGRALNGQARDTDPARLQNDDGQWVMPAKNYSSTRFSGLDEINAGNVSKLGCCGRAGGACGVRRVGDSAVYR